MCILLDYIYILQGLIYATDGNIHTNPFIYTCIYTVLIYGFSSYPKTQNITYFFPIKVQFRSFCGFTKFSYFVILTVLNWLWAVIPMVCLHLSIYHPMFQSCQFFCMGSRVFCLAICPVTKLSNFYSLIVVISIRLQSRFCAHIFRHHHMVGTCDNYYLSCNNVEFIGYLPCCTSNTVSIKYNFVRTENVTQNPSQD